MEFPNSTPGLRTSLFEEILAKTSEFLLRIKTERKFSSQWLGLISVND